MARVALCDRCGIEIETFYIKHIGFSLNFGRMTLYDVCDKCYDELEKCMKAKEEEGERV